jgi:hypothetical protein
MTAEVRAPEEEEIQCLTGDDIIEDDMLDMAQLLVAGGDPPPTGTWSGPFGFFRCVGYVFFALNIFAIGATAYSGYSQDWFGMSMNFFLIISSFIAAVSSYCHEGLANEVSVYARTNDELTAQSESLALQIKEMETVKLKYQSLLDDLQGDDTLLKDLVQSLHRVVLMKNLQTLLSSFMRVDGTNTQSFDSKEVDTFFNSTWAVLREAAGLGSDSHVHHDRVDAFPLNQLYREALNAGSGKCLDRDDVKLLVYACSISGDPDRPHTSKALLWLVLFCFNPDVYMNGLVQSLISMRERDEEQIRMLVSSIKDKHRGAFKYSEDEDCLRFRL